MKILLYTSFFCGFLSDLQEDVRTEAKRAAETVR